MHEVRLKVIVWLVRGASCKVFGKSVSLAIPPHDGLRIDMDFVDFVSTDTATGKVVCNMVAYETHGNEDDFKAECDKFLNDGWERI